jgi:hypothetical protein
MTEGVLFLVMLRPEIAMIEEKDFDISPRLGASDCKYYSGFLTPHHSTTPLQHHGTTPLLYYSTTPLLHYSTTPLLHWTGLDWT